MSLGVQASHKCFELEMPLSICLTPSFALLLLHNINVLTVHVLENQHNSGVSIIILIYVYVQTHAFGLIMCITYILKLQASNYDNSQSGK